MAHSAIWVWLAVLLASAGIVNAQLLLDPNICSCSAVVFNANKARSLLTNKCYSPAEAIDGITDVDQNGWGAARGGIGGSPIAVFPLAERTTTNGITIFSNSSSVNYLEDFSLEYTTEKRPKIRASQWKPFPGMQVIKERLFCQVDNANVTCSRPQEYLCIGWEPKTITALRVVVNRPKKFLITELVLRSC